GQEGTCWIGGLHWRDAAGSAEVATAGGSGNNGHCFSPMALAKATDAVSIATLVIAGIAGVGLGGIIVALINARQERKRQLRESMLTAADEFLRAAASALSHLRRLHPSARELNLGLIALFPHGRAMVDSSADLGT